MIARTVSIQTRPLAGQDSFVQATNLHSTPRRQDHLLKMTSAATSISNFPDTNMDDSVALGTSERSEEIPQKDHWASGLICFCRTPEGFNGTLIACDGPCEEWYHNSCVEVTPEEAERIETFVCPICTRNDYGKTVWREGTVGQSKANGVDDNEELTLSGFPRRTATERKREHRSLSLRAEGRARNKARRLKR
ncbi:hypothetical protein DOTSEDRAFT_23665 [Dothistroma septosporum NZE10]|uniref:PHD-type domain-containing protein n=1 Tax=Dothistroma septosporum (strain NZE10 / CBS 128990) TaxID=675120 RepID=N1PRV1_DOTSN|nr:hypothetical protein DOTSEDRAFT_23665 [Dothistroma septosporum NZE10]